MSGGRNRGLECRNFCDTSPKRRWTFFLLLEDEGVDGRRPKDFLSRRPRPLHPATVAVSGAPTFPHVQSRPAYLRTHFSHARGSLLLLPIIIRFLLLAVFLLVLLFSEPAIFWEQTDR